MPNFRRYTVYVLIKKYVLNEHVHISTRLYGILVVINLNHGVLYPYMEVV